MKVRYCISIARRSDKRAKGNTCEKATSMQRRRQSKMRRWENESKRVESEKKVAPTDPLIRTADG